MTRTPDEIKKGLECCIAGIYDVCHYSAYYEVGSGDCVDDVKRDALTLIRQLQAENAEQAERIKQLEAERDAALEDKRGECTYCAYLPGETIPQTCFDCANKGFYRWKWRGVQKGDGNV